MADSNRPRGECQHGQLARQCELCEKDATIAEQAATIARLEGERDAHAQRLRDISVALSDARCNAMPILEGVRWMVERTQQAEAERDALKARVKELEALLPDEQVSARERIINWQMSQMAKRKEQP